MKISILLTTTMLAATSFAFAQTTASDINAANKSSANPDNAEVYKPLPNVVSPGKTFSDAPSDAIVLFDGKNLDEWVSVEKKDAPAAWTVADGIITVNKATGDIETKRKFTSSQLHIEWRIPADIKGEGQERG